MSAALQELIDVLDLEEIEVNLFRGHHTDEKRIRTFGGQVAGQALVAAGRTVDPDKLVHSLHAYFLRPGDPSAPIVYQVDRIRDGRSFATRRVVATQHGEAIFNLSASFHVVEDGVEHQLPMPTALDPETLPSFKERFAPYAEQMGDWYHRPKPIEMRFEGPTHRERKEPGGEPRQNVWIKPNGALPDDPLIHACVVAYASDMSLLDSIMLTHGISWDDGSMSGASLDHAMWFHRPFRADQWLLYSQESTAAWGSRGLARGEIFTSDGTLVVSVVQEGLIRLTEKGRERIRARGGR